MSRRAPSSRASHDRGWPARISRSRAALRFAWPRVLERPREGLLPRSIVNSYVRSSLSGVRRAKGRPCPTGCQCWRRPRAGDPRVLIQLQDDTPRPARRIRLCNGERAAGGSFLIVPCRVWNASVQKRGNHTAEPAAPARTKGETRPQPRSGALKAEMQDWRGQRPGYLQPPRPEARRTGRCPTSAHDTPQMCQPQPRRLPRSRRRFSSSPIRLQRASRRTHRSRLARSADPFGFARVSQGGDQSPIHTRQECSRLRPRPRDAAPGGQWRQASSYASQRPNPGSLPQ